MYNSVVGFLEGKETLKITLSPNEFIYFSWVKLENGLEPLQITSSNKLSPKNDYYTELRIKYDAVLYLINNDRLKDYISLEYYENKLANQAHLNYYNYAIYLQNVKEDIANYIHNLPAK
jgi:hypothetical protein